jgi:ABC-type siderophore export system fused ATPase/permease subunit
MSLLLILAYYWLFPDSNVFLIVAIVIISILFVATIFVRRGRAQWTRHVDERLDQHYSEVLDSRKKGKKLTQTQVRFCKLCKRRIDKDTVFCSHCGTEQD